MYPLKLFLRNGLSQHLQISRLIAFGYQKSLSLVSGHDLLFRGDLLGLKRGTMGRVSGLRLGAEVSRAAEFLHMPNRSMPLFLVGCEKRMLVLPQQS